MIGPHGEKRPADPVASGVHVGRLITGEVEPGTYAVEGIKFSMTGWWALAMGK